MIPTATDGSPPTTAYPSDAIPTSPCRSRGLCEQPVLYQAASGGSLQGKTNGLRVNYWTPFNPSNEFPRPVHNSSVNYMSALAMQDASYIRLRTLSLGYTFPRELISKIRIEKLRIYATATNLATFTKVLSYSPELTPGAYPEPQTFVFGVNLSF